MPGPQYLPTWEEAMGRAAERLRALDDGYAPPGARTRMASELAKAHAAIATAWITYARELSERSRGGSAGG
jgi:hypothetical protein